MHYTAARTEVANPLCMRGRAFAAGRSLCRPEDDLANFAALGIANSIRAGRIRSGDLSLTHHVQNLHFMARGNESIQGGLIIRSVHQKIRNEKYDPRGTADAQQFIDRRVHPGLASASE